ncbi:hypothetical protein [Roseibium aggregatum]|uniref:Uncharacterized protein n=1 Tax=Roseibium aggregatum TaxID=187304 RepID=A0A939EKV8_9HYPH|nr:hypothetical protein [Roseibium aggregatum]MBN9673525.1 hypothetical protein [Roseibium aggregatum]
MATTSFQDLRKTVETVALEKTLDPTRLGMVLGGEFAPTEKATAYHQTYRGRMTPASLFSSCELRFPKSARATSGLVICQLAETRQIGRDEVETAYKGHLTFDPASPRAPENSPSYLSVTDGKTKISFGFPGNGDKASVVVIDMKTR